MSLFHSVLFYFILVLVPLCHGQQPTPYIPIQPHTSTTTAQITEWHLTTLVSSSSSITASTSPAYQPYVKSYQTTYFSPTWPATQTFNDAEVTSIRVAFSSVDATWSSASFFPSLQSAVVAVAPSTVLASLSNPTASWDWDAIVQAPWYTTVPKEWQDIITVQEEALQNAFEVAVGVKKNDVRRIEFEMKFSVLAIGVATGVIVFL